MTLDTPSRGRYSYDNAMIRLSTLASELLQPWRHRLVRFRSTLLAPAPLPLVLTDARSVAVLAPAPMPLVLADARSAAFLAIASPALVLADAALHDLFFVLFISTHFVTTSPEPICRSNSRVSGKV